MSSLTRDDLRLPFVESETPREDFLVGTEAEKFGVIGTDPLMFEGEPGVAMVLSRLEERFGWKGKREAPGRPIIALKRKGASVTLEPGAQVELSGAALKTIHETYAEMEEHASELRSVTKEFGVKWLGMGFHPFSRPEDLSWVPKLRYSVMRKYLPTKGSHAHHMMQRTCTAQTNLDFASEEDGMRKLRVGLRLQPVTTAMFANSPFAPGEPFEGKSFRCRVWLDVDPDRTGLLPFAWKEDATYDDYIEWALDAPMFLFLRDGEIIHNTGQTFRAFNADGYDGHTATGEDWYTHLKTMFPEVRLQNTLELRGVDSQSTLGVCAASALFKGIFYDDKALGEAEALFESLTHDEAERARPDIATMALGASYGDRPIREYAEKLIDIARGGLERIGDYNEAGDDETVFLNDLSERVGKGLCPADELLARLEGLEGEQRISALHRYGRF